MMILHQKKARLVKYETYSRNPDSGSGIYLTADKVAQCRPVAENMIEKKEEKGNRKEDSPPKFSSSTEAI